MTGRINVAPRVVRWARVRSGRSLTDLAKRFPKLPDWEDGVLKPTLRQLEDFAAATHTPIGYLFLPQPPQETLSIPDFRTFGDKKLNTPSPDLLDTIYQCEERQGWFREYLDARGGDPVALVGSASIEMDPVAAAIALQDSLRFGLAGRVEFSTFADALRGLSEHAEGAGVLVMINGVVGSNTHRRLNPEEFRGFALIDDLAPLVFVNGADTKSAQIFSLAHELAHVALGGSAISRPDLAEIDTSNRVERWCNEVAAELLVPMASLREEYVPSAGLTEELSPLARFYKVSTLVVLRRIFDGGYLSQSEYVGAYRDELRRVLNLSSEAPSGGNFYSTQPMRVSKRFARALISDTLEGGTLHRDAFRLLGFRKASTFYELSARLGVA